MAKLSLKKKPADTEEKNIAPEKTTIAPPETKISKKRKLRKLLSKNYDVWKRFLPLQIGIDKVLFDKFGDTYGRQNIGNVIYWHVKHVDYVANIALGGDRLNLDGEVVGKISDRDQETAVPPR